MQTVYSIDESFLRFERMRQLWPSWSVMGQAIRHEARKRTGIPVCVGIEPTKTLAKLANHIAKKRAKFGGVFGMMANREEKLARIFSTIDVAEVWGVGRRIATKLNAMNICNVEDLRRASPKLIRLHFSVVLERTVAELQGLSCLSLDDVAPPKKQIVSSRSFGHMVMAESELGEALTTYVSRAAEKLRIQGSVAGALQVFVMTNVFRETDPQYSNGIVIPLPNPTNNTFDPGCRCPVRIKAHLQAWLRIQKVRRNADGPVTSEPRLQPFSITAISSTSVRRPLCS